ncbi:MAG TPA: hypothetical protein V6D46_03135 [Coleofasciculaceae cyanobacterium]
MNCAETITDRGRGMEGSKRGSARMGSTVAGYDAWYPISFKIAIPEGKEILLALGFRDCDSAKVGGNNLRVNPEMVGAR